MLPCAVASTPSVFHPERYPSTQSWGSQPPCCSKEAILYLKSRYPTIPPLAISDPYRVSRCKQEKRGSEIATQLDIKFDQDAYKRLRQTDGVYTLLTNLPEEYSGKDILLRYKQQFNANPRFADRKGPLGLLPLFLKEKSRLEALVFVVSVALMVYGLLEYTLRRSLKETESTVPRLYSKSPTQKPTARMLLAAFEFCSVTKEDDGESITYAVQPFNQLQALIFQHLGIDDPWGFLR